MSACKPKDKNVNTHHIPKRNIGLGKQLMEAVVELGADVLEANYIYVGENLDPKIRAENYQARIALQDHAKRLTFRMEHIFMVLHFDSPFAESTSSYMMDLLTETREMDKFFRRLKDAYYTKREQRSRETDEKTGCHGGRDTPDQSGTGL